MSDGSAGSDGGSSMDRRKFMKKATLAVGALFFAGAGGAGCSWGDSRTEGVTNADPLHESTVLFERHVLGALEAQRRTRGMGYSFHNRTQDGLPLAVIDHMGSSPESVWPILPYGSNMALADNLPGSFAALEWKVWMVSLGPYFPSAGFDYPAETAVVTIYSNAASLMEVSSHTRHPSWVRPGGFFEVGDVVHGDGYRDFDNWDPPTEWCNSGQFIGTVVKTDLASRVDLGGNKLSCYAYPRRPLEFYVPVYKGGDGTAHSTKTLVGYVYAGSLDLQKQGCCAQFVGEYLARNTGFLYEQARPAARFELLPKQQDGTPADPKKTGGNVTGYLAKLAWLESVSTQDPRRLTKAGVRIVSDPAEVAKGWRLARNIGLFNPDDPSIQAYFDLNQLRRRAVGNGGSISLNIPRTIG